MLSSCSPNKKRKEIKSNCDRKKTNLPYIPTRKILLMQCDKTSATIGACSVRDKSQYRESITRVDKLHNDR